MLHLKENMLYQSIIVVMIEYLKLFEMLYYFSGHKANKISDSMMCKTCITINGGQFLFARQKSLCLIKQHFSSILKMSLKPLYSHIITNSKYYRGIIVQHHSNCKFSGECRSLIYFLIAFTVIMLLKFEYMLYNTNQKNSEK